MSDPATYDLDPDYAAALAERANRAMLQHGVTPTPENFAVWFAYVRGDSIELKLAIDRVIAAGRPFDPKVCRDLVATHLAPPSPRKVVGNIPEQLKSVMDAAKLFVTAAIADNRTQIKALGGVAEQAEGGVDPRTLVASLMEELTKAATRATELEANLSKTSGELDVIREELNEAEKRANTDTLTGLPSRRVFDEFLGTAQQTAIETKKPLSVLLLDIDRFRQFNDKYGHGVGDQLLRLLAKTLRDRLRESDLPARYGGEELVAALPGCDLAACEALAERIRKSVSECRITRRSSGETLPGITVSIGVAQLRGNESTAELVARCDRALVLAKTIGRNRVVSEVRLEGKAVVNSSLESWM
jgi:diguanylate cyclase